MTVFFQNFLRSPATVQIDSLFQCLFDFLIACRHFFSCFQTEHVNFRIGTSAADSRRIDCNISTSDYDYITLKSEAFFCACFSQEIHSSVCASGIFSTDSRLSSSLASDCRIKASVSLLSQFFDRNVFSDLNSTADLHTKLTDHIDLGSQKVFFQFVGWNTITQHTARFCIFFKNRRFVSGQCKEVRTG